MSRRPLHAAALAGLLWVLAGIPAAAPAKSDFLGGFGMNAFGAGISLIYDQPSSPIPASPTGEMHAAYSLAELSNGPTGHGVASEIWPGGVAATAGPYVETTFWDGFRGGWKENSKEEAPEQLSNPHAVPLWPIRAETFLPQDPHDAESSLGPAGRMRSHSEGDDNTHALVHSVTKSNEVIMPAVVEADVVTSSATARVDGGLAVSEATAKLKDVSLLDGLVTIEKLVSTASSSSNGRKAKLDGSTQVSGLRIAGQGFTIDEDGLHSDGNDSGPVTGQLNQATEDALADAGVSLILAGSNDYVDGASGTRTIGGLVVGIDARALDQAVSALPEEMQTQIRENVAFDQRFQVVLGGVGVKTSAAPPFEYDFGTFDPLPTSPPITPPAAPTAPPQVLGGGTTATPSEVPFTRLPSVSPAPGRGGQLPVVAPPLDPIAVEGIPAAIVLLVLAAAVGAATLMRRMSDTLLAAGHDTRCPLDE